MNEPSDSIEPSGAATVHCTSCDTDVEPTGRGHCPRCGKFVPANIVALVHGGRRQQLTPEQDGKLEQVLADVQRDPNGTTLREWQKDYASACIVCGQLSAYLASAGALTSAGRRRAAFDAFLAASARAERLAMAIREAHAEAPTSSADALEITKIERVIVHATTHDIARPAATTRTTVSAPPSTVRVQLDSNTDVADVDDSQQQPCAYGCGTRCAEIKANNLDAWRTLHSRDPEEIERRNRKATAEMMMQIGKPNSWEW